MSTPTKSGSRRSLRIVSKCSTQAEFIAAFGPLCDQRGIFIATRTPKSKGTEVRFNITLSDSTPMIVGSGEVVESDSDGVNAFGRPGMRIEFAKLDDVSQQIVDELRARSGRAAQPAAAKKPVLPPPITVPKLIPPISKRISAQQEDDEETEVKASPLDLLSTAENRDLSSGDVAEHSSNSTADGARTRGSDFILPANPFGELGAAALEAFVECTLYEESGQYSFPADEPSEASMVAQPAPITGSVPHWWPTPTSVDSANDGAPVVDELADLVRNQREASEAESYAVSEAMAAAALEDDTAVSSPPHEASAPMASAGMLGTVPMPPHLAAQVTPMPELAPTMPYAQAPATPVHTADVISSAYFGPKNSLLAKVGQQRLLVLMVSAAVIAGSFSLIVGYLLWGHSDGGNDTRAVVAKVEEPGRSTPPVTKSAGDTLERPAAAAGSDENADQHLKGEPDAPEPEDAPEPAAAPEPPPGPDSDKTVAAEPDGETGPCTARVESSPEGATIMLAKDSLGTTPATVGVPCEPITLTLVRPRYQSESVTVTPNEAAPVVVSARLSRPSYKLLVSSAPAGAAVTVNGRSIGTTPASTTLPGFQSATVTLTKTGYLSWSKKVYLKSKSQTVRASLKKVVKKTTSKTRKTSSKIPAKSSKKRVAK